MFKVFSTYLSDPETAACCGDENFIRKMLDTEIALAKAQAKMGVIPQVAADDISNSLKNVIIAPEDLTAGTLSNGVPTLPLLALAKKHLSPESQHYLHWGATSQDIVDTASVLIFKEVIAVFEIRLQQLIQQLTLQAKRYQNTPTIGRTRTQHAVPIRFSQKFENWYRPLQRHLQRLQELKPRLLVAQLGGAAGNLSAMADQGQATAQLLAQNLHLGYAPVWHAQRDGIVEFSSWMALLTGSLGKMAQDILLLGQTEIGEVVENAAGGGKSSTMPHKNNPVLSEAIVALSKYIGNQAGLNFQAMLHQHERDGAAWALEWLTLPPMMTATGTCLKHALFISQNMEVNEKAVQLNLEKLKGLVFSEKAGFILAGYMAPKQAKNIVEQACNIALEQEIHLVKALEMLTAGFEINWEKQYLTFIAG